MTVLQKRIQDSGLKLKKVAEILGIDRTTLFKKLKGTRKFTDEELQTLSVILRSPVKKEDATDELDDK